MQVEKRNGDIVPFVGDKIGLAVEKAMLETIIGVDDKLIKKVVEKVVQECNKVSEKAIHIEQIQDLVELALMESNRKDVAKRYILYREERNKLRGIRVKNEYTYLSDEFLGKYKSKPDPFPFEVGKFVYYRTYSRPKPEEKRRERWWETVARVVDFNIGLQISAMKRQGIRITFDVINKLEQEGMEIYDLMYNLKLFPSGRSLWVGRTPSSYLYPMSNFNCSFFVMDNLKKFAELLFILTLGTGAGISVERKYVNTLPKVNTKIEVIHKNYVPVPKRERKEYTELHQKSANVLELVVGDSKFGWSKAVDMYFEIITSKQYADIDFILINYDSVRPAGERLKTFGGFASGHTALSIMFEKINTLIREKGNKKSLQWQSLRPIDCLDIATVIAENVVSGGTRRSAEIIFCDSDDKEVIDAKGNIYYQNEQGGWETNTAIEHRTLSNNTVLYNTRPTREELREHFKKMRVSGEPAIGNLEEMRRRRPDAQGTNPCGEILLRDRGVCNLTEVNVFAFVREDGTLDLEGILRAQELSARMGYRMATIELELHEWNLVHQEDRLVGTSLTGVMDAFNALNYSTEEIKILLQQLREKAVEGANNLADYLQMNRPKLVTTIKPSGTISQLPTVSSGMHYSHSPYYIRRVRVGINDPIVAAMREMGYEYIEESMSKVVYEFPVKAPEGKTKYDVSAIEQLEMYKLFMENYTTHNSSNTIHVRPHEWEEVEDWVFTNWDSLVGVTFLSLDDSFYPLMPYEAITKEQYEEMAAKMPKFNPAILGKYENFDEEELDLESDCDGGVCPVR